MAKISSSILACDFYKLGQEIETALKLGVDWIHVDVMDGHFVPPLTFGSKVIRDIKRNNKNVFIDAHLMVTNPESLIDQFIQAGTDLINFHSEVACHGDRLVSLIKENGRLAGITINPTTPVEYIKHYLPIIDLVLVMSVNPGYSGQKCLEYSFQKIIDLVNIRKENNYKYLIQVDGGIYLYNIEKPLNAGADVIVSGSEYFDSSIEEKKKFISIIHDRNHNSHL